MGRGWRSKLRTSVIVNLTTGRSFKGVLWATSGPLLVLRQAELLEGNRQAMPVDGEVLVDVARVEFVQVVEQR